MKILLAGLGTSQYKRVTYQVTEEQQHTSEYFSVALASVMECDKVIVLTTESAKILHWDELKRQLNALNITCEQVNIPDGKIESELWDIFDAIADYIPEGSSIVLDITHSFRTLSLIFLVSLSYLRAVKSVTIDGVYYGAFEAVNNDKDLTLVRPVFDLTNFMTLLDWSYAGKLLDDFGNGEVVGQLLKERQTKIARSGTETEIPKKLKTVGEKLNEQSLALDLVRPDEIMERSHIVMKELNLIANELKWAKPFKHLLDKFNKQSDEFATNTLRNEEQLKINLMRQLKICQWYCKHKRFLAASLLQRELLVSWFMYQQQYDVDSIYNGKKDSDDKSFRELSENSLNKLKHDRKKIDSVIPNLVTEIDVVQLWDIISTIRNDIAHTGMRREPTPAKKLVEKIKKIQDNMEQLFQDTL
jgi:CRISPR-associated DxTHG motif protein